MEAVWYDIRTMAEEELEALLHRTDPRRRKRMENIQDPDDRKRTAAGEMLARQLLARRLGVEEAAVPLEWDEDGKPTVAQAELYCSISHSGPYVVCAVARVPVGVDVEVVRLAEEKFIRRTCSEQELAYIRYGDAGCYQRFWECWTAKEALFKLTGHGPLLKLSGLALPEGVVLDHTLKNGCTMTVALALQD